jgi:hypothetical protein
MVSSREIYLTGNLFQLYALAFDFPILLFGLHAAPLTTPQRCG